ncbi:MAG TPA: hypothetical protein VMZ71_16080, partial [Gemmataceae bacterium]|nr:hypothetical protein [Gemmataceae bacterium]
HIFAGVRDTGELTTPPLDALLQSPELRLLAEKYGVAPGQLNHLSQLVGSARGLLGVSLSGSGSTEAKLQKNAGIIAAHFFRWLRNATLEACGPLRATGLNPEAIPVRVTVPAFAHGRGVETHPGCQVLTHALAQAGWVVHPDRPIVSEPYSNVVGALTEGRNILTPKRRAQLGKMFRDGPIMRPVSTPRDHPKYRAWSIDIGAFTTDFAALDVESGGHEIGALDEAITVRQHSVPLGILNLDERVLDVLPSEQREWLKTAGTFEWMDFRQRVYTNRQTLRTVAIGAIGGPKVDQAIADFAKQLASACEQFVSEAPPVKLQELVLTGGGNAIPTVCEVLTNTMRGGGREFVHVFWPQPAKRTEPSGVRKLDTPFARGGSALGGASIYFEREFYAGRA